MKCRKCNGPERNITVWPWICLCKMRYESPDDPGTQLIIQPVIEPLKREACKNRGDILRREQCKSCRGNVQIKVFTCAIHGECSLSPLEDIRHCAMCGDYAAT